MKKRKPLAIFNPYRCKLYPFSFDMDLGEGLKTYVWEDGLWQPLEKIAPSDRAVFSLNLRPSDKQKDVDSLLIAWCAILYKTHYPWLSMLKTARMIRVYLKKKHNRHLTWETIRNRLLKELPHIFPERKPGRPPKSR